VVAVAKQAWRAEHRRGRRPAVWSPGEHLVIDWGSEDGLHVFCAVLAWCRFRFVRFAAGERAETTLALLAECFEVLGGVPGKVLVDRMGCLKGGVVANVVVPTAEYVRFAGHYGFRPGFCEAADPESKGIVEHLVGYAKSDLMPQAPFGDLAAANAAAAAWCAEVNGAVHSEICAVPAEPLVIERELLGPLPSLRASIGRQVTRKVDRLSCVRFASARYSVPVRLIGTEVRLRTDDGRLLVIMTGTGQVVAEHVLVAPGGASVRDEHYGGPRPATPRRAVRPRTAAEKEFCALGPAAEVFITGAAAAGHTRLGPELAELNTLRAAHGEQAFLDALERLQALLDYFVQTTHPGTIQLDGDTASGRTYMSELGRFRGGRSELNYAIYHDRYQRTPDGWKFTERVYEVRYLDTTPLAGSAPLHRSLDTTGGHHAHHRSSRRSPRLPGIGARGR
jgi:SnoaL-like domain